jgi:hypothetical protein
MGVHKMRKTKDRYTPMGVLCISLHLIFRAIRVTNEVHSMDLERVHISLK